MLDFADRIVLVSALRLYDGSVNFGSKTGCVTDVENLKVLVVCL
jgi:hypothetical protein